MNKIKYYIVIFTILYPLVAFSKNREFYDKHFVGFDVFGAYTTLLHTSPTHNFAQGDYIGLGVAYEYNRYNNILIQTGFNYSQNFKLVNVANDSIIKEGIIDTQQDEYRHKYVFKDRKDASIAHNIEIPLLVGQKIFVGQKRASFYYLAGVKFNVLLKSYSIITCDVTTTGLYDRYIDEFHDMYNHALFNKSINVINNGIDFKSGISAYIESGYTRSSFSKIYTGFGHRQGKEYVFRIAAFAEYGVPIVPKIMSNNLDLYTIYDKSPINVDAIKMNHVYYTFAKNAFFQNVNVGIKLTFLFNVYTHPCILCPRLYKEKIHVKKRCSHCRKQRENLQQKKYRY